MMGKKLEKIEKLGINFFFFFGGGEFGVKGGECVPKSTKTHYSQNKWTEHA